MSTQLRKQWSLFLSAHRSSRTRRRPFRIAGSILVSALALTARAPRVLAAPDPLEFNLATAVARGDLDYSSPTTRSDEGMPVGNGRMGSLVWTTPSALKFQLNRCDVFGEDASSMSFPHAD